MGEPLHKILYQGNQVKTQLYFKITSCQNVQPIFVTPTRGQAMLQQKVKDNFNLYTCLRPVKWHTVIFNSESMLSCKLFNNKCCNNQCLHTLNYFPYDVSISFVYMWTIPRAKVGNWWWKRGRLGKKEGDFLASHIWHMRNAFKKNLTTVFKLTDRVHLFDLDINLTIDSSLWHSFIILAR